MSVQACNSEGKLVAMRSIKMQEVVNWQQLEQLESEAAILKQLNHPGIPACLASHDDMESFSMVQVCSLQNPTNFFSWLHPLQHYNAFGNPSEGFHKFHIQRFIYRAVMTSAAAALAASVKLPSGTCIWGDSLFPLCTLEYFGFLCQALYQVFTWIASLSTNTCAHNAAGVH